MPDAPAEPVDFDQHVQGLLDRLNYEQARTAQDYDTHRAALADHHGAMSAQVADLLARKAKLDPAVEAFLHTPGAPLDDATRDACREYLEVCAALHEALSARRMSYGATLPPGEQAPGGPLE